MGRTCRLLDSAKIAGHMRRMRTLLAAAAAFVVLVLGLTGANAQVGVPEVESYFNSIRTLQARFVQSNPSQIETTQRK